MNRPPRWRRRLGALALMPVLAVLAPAALAASDTPGDYSQRWPLTLPEQAALVRLPLPASVLAVLQHPDGRDLRVFNGAGQPVPLALTQRSDEAAPAPPAAAPVGFTAWPIVAGRGPGGDAGASSLRIEDAGAQRVVRIEWAPPSPAAGASAAAAASGQAATAAAVASASGGGADIPAPVGALIDARAHAQAVGSVLLDADGPSARPWRFSLSSSSDLQQWHPLGSVTVYRHQGQWATPPRIVLDQVLRQGAFLRIDWSATDGAPLAGVQVRGATLEAPRPTAGTPQLALPLVLPPPRDAHTIEWQVPFATPIQALDVSLGEGNALLPVRLLARQQPGQAWTPLAQAVVFRLTQGGSTQSSPPITWGDARAWREWRLEADASSPGFTQPPQVTARLAPLQLVFVASGPGPFTLAAGRTNASASALPLASVVPGYDASQPLRLPQASLADGGDPAAAVPTRAPGSPWDLRQALLWAVLLSGVLALGLMAVRLMRSLPPAQADEPPAAP